jgi:hypothetical protein
VIMKDRNGTPLQLGDIIKYSDKCYFLICKLEQSVAGGVKNEMMCLRLGQGDYFMGVIRASPLNPQRVEVVARLKNMEKFLNEATQR